MQQQHDDDTNKVTRFEEEELQSARASVETLTANLDNLNQRKADVLNNLEQLRERINIKRRCYLYRGAEISPSFEVTKGIKTLKVYYPTLFCKDLESQESVLQSDYDVKRTELEAEVCNLEEKIAAGMDSEGLCKDLDCLLSESLEKLNAAKKELAARLRAVMSVKRKLGEVPTQSELIQYERGFSDVNDHIQEKHRQTRKYYATYNTLLEIKELMLKETSLLNSISSQFQDAITTTNGCTKLIASMEGIVKGSQQRLQKVELGLQEEQKVSDALKKRYAAAMAEQRRCYSLLKAFQEECAKNERLRGQTSV
ncbi:coiled-coil domain-containing protein 93 [Populus alba x Populus x berolinensis]|nr:coiled-coil domain-containing protein 93 [Populus alba x Populus x berolinensis]